MHASVDYSLPGKHIRSQRICCNDRDGSSCFSKMSLHMQVTDTPRQAVSLLATEHRSGEPSGELRGDSLETRDTSCLARPNLVLSKRAEEGETNAPMLMPTWLRGQYYWHQHLSCHYHNRRNSPYSYGLSRCTHDHACGGAVWDAAFVSFTGGSRAWLGEPA
jgi:hypothetical protein